MFLNLRAIHNLLCMVNRSSLLYIIILCTTVLVKTAAQQPAAIDSLKTALAAAKTPDEKGYWYDNLSRTMMNVDPKAADSLGEQFILFAEESRSRKLMFDAYMSNGLRCSYFRGQKAYIERSIGYYERALLIAEQNNMEKRSGAALLQLADIHLAIPDKDKALKYVAEGFSRINATKDDSLKVESNNIYGKVYLARNDKKMALRQHLIALEISEELKADNAEKKRLKNELKRNCYLYLANFYTTIESYDKAIDNYTSAYKMLDNMTDRRVPYQRCIDINAIGNLFAQKKSYDIAVSYFERSIRMADSLQFATLKLPGYISLLNQYLRMDQPEKALAYLNSSKGQELKEYLTTFRMSPVFDQAYAYVYTETGRYDSAKKYFDKALPYFESAMNDISRVGIYLQMGKLFTKTGETNKAIENYLKAKEMGEKNGSLEITVNAAKYLDSLYAGKGDFRTASKYNGMYYLYKDSIDKLKKEKELTQVEATAEEQRNERIRKEQEEIKRRKNNIQYMAITFGIVILFLALVVLGMFKVSAGLIKATGFFVFLMLFEFIFLVFKKNIYSITHGEPWKDLAFMIGLAALLVPLHHWLEHKVLHYLTSHNRLTSAGLHIKNKLLRRTKNGEL